jgi:peptidoglycan/LPS O-acetylase OafA/YrhL
MKNSNYRSEIDGLRALSLIFVILFHAGIPGFSGGYIGVDIFFVISGYLIAGIIFNDLKNKNFSIYNFYERRVRRILPALIFVILASIPLALILMVPEELKDFCQSIFSNTIFSSNFFFLFKSGYFEQASEMHPLLHTWSLSVEEQFYFIFPIIAILIFKCSRNILVSILLILIFISFLISDYQLKYSHEAAFFLPFGRAWELLCGSLINFLPRFKFDRKFWYDVLALFGLCLISLPVIFLSKESPFPGFNAVPVIFGSMILINFTNKKSFFGKFLSLPPLVGLGLISYSTYLWHQPLFAFSRLYLMKEPSMIIYIFLIILSVLLGFLSWKYIENPFRNKGIIKKDFLVKSILPIWIFLMIFGLWGHFTNGFCSIKLATAGNEFKLFAKDLNSIFIERNMNLELSKTYGSRSFTDGEGLKKVLVVGDSRASDVFMSLWLNKDLFPTNEFRLINLDETLFKFIDSKEVPTLNSDKIAVEKFKDIIENNEIDSVLIACGWSSSGSKNINQLKALLGFLNVNRIIVYGSSGFSNINSLMYKISNKNLSPMEKAEYFTKNTHHKSYLASMNLKALSDEYGFKFIDSYKLFKFNRSNKDLVYLLDELGRPLIVDQLHLSTAAAFKFGKMHYDEGWLSD